MQPNTQLGTTAETNRLLGRNAFDVVTGAPINSKNLQSNSQITLPETPVTSNPATPIIATALKNAEATDQATLNVVKETSGLDKIKAAKDEILNQIKGVFGKTTEAQNTAINDNNAIAPYQKDLADINKQIADVTVAYRGEKDAVTGRGDITQSAQAGLNSNIDSKYGRTLADLAIRQSAANQNVTALQTAADRKLALTLAPLQTELSYYKDYLLANNDKLTNDEKDKINMIISEKDKLIKAQTDKEKGIADLITEGLKNGVKIPDNVVQSMLGASSALEATRIANNAGVSLAKPGTGTSATYVPIDASSIVDKNAGNPTWGGLSYNALYNASKNYLATGGKLPTLGLGSKGDVLKAKQAVINYGGQLADAMGLDMTQISALYKANSKAASDIIGRVARIETTSNTLSAQFPRLAQLATNVGNLGITESDLTKTKAEIKKKFGSVDAANYIELLQTIRGDYSAMQAAVAGSRGAQYFSESAAQAIPLGLTPEQYLGLKQTIETSAQLAQGASGEEASALLNPNYSSTILGKDSTIATSTPSGYETYLKAIGQ